MGGPRAECARLRAAARRRFGGRAAPDGAGSGRGAAGDAVRGRGGPGSGRPAPRWQLPGVREAAPCSPWRRGRGRRFPGQAARSRREGAWRGDGAPRAGPPRPACAKMNGPAVPGQAEAGTSGPAGQARWPQAWRLPRPAGLPGRGPWGKGGRAGSALAVGSPGSFGDPSSSYRS